MIRRLSVIKTIGAGLLIVTGIVHAEGNPWALNNQPSPSSQTNYWQGSNSNNSYQPQQTVSQPRATVYNTQQLFQPYNTYGNGYNRFTPYNRYTGFNRYTPNNRYTSFNRYTPYNRYNTVNRYNSPYAMNRYNAYRPAFRRPPPHKKHKHKSKMWGESPPSEWMSMPPDRDKWIQAWDDMIDAPYRQGQYPGGFYAPEMILPNPVDMAGQFKDNAVDLPEQLKKGEIGNVVSDTNEDE